ncbi:MAG: phosphatidate cytidylyltransferase, partial [Proteobacteria bacterium]|nr:phosphatidate cytidylyltransferase [Pseudomonadota bacterium]
MLKTRILTALVALTIMLGVFILGSPNFMRFFFLGLVGISCWEMSAMVFPRIYRSFSAKQNDQPPKWLRPLLLGIAGLLFVLTAYTDQFGSSVIVLCLLAGLMFGIFLIPEIDLSFGVSAGILLCVIYGTFPWLAIWKLYQLSPDSRYIYLLCVIVWSGDTGAYFSGRKFGKRKLAPHMSPNKTWEGSVGGLIASVCGAAIFKYFYVDMVVGWVPIFVCSIFGGILGQLGDLVESTFKRYGG